MVYSTSNRLNEVGVFFSPLYYRHHVHQGDCSGSGGTQAGPPVVATLPRRHLCRGMGLGFGLHAASLVKLSSGAP